MKKLIILPGNSLKNKLWGEEIADYFSGEFDEVYTQNYDHWDSGKDVIDFKREVTKLKELVVTEADKNYEYYIFAKSFGSILTLMAVYEEVIKPVKCVLFGIPLNLAEDQNIFRGDWSPVVNYQVPTLAFHNDNDPVALLNVTRQLLIQNKFNAINFRIKEADDHSYTDFAAYQADIKEFLGF